MTDLYVIQLERGAGSMTGEIVAACSDLDEVREYLTAPPEVWRGATLAVYECTRVDEEALR